MNQRQVDNAREKLKLEEKIRDVVAEINVLKDQAVNADEKEQAALDKKKAKAQKYLDQLTEGRKVSEDILNTEEKSIENMSKMATAEYDISDAKRRKLSYQKEIEKIDKSKGIYTEKEKKALKDILKINIKMADKNIDLAKSIFGKIDEKMKMSNTRGAAAGKVVEMGKGNDTSPIVPNKK